MSYTDEEMNKKRLWLRPSMNGDDATVIKGLLDFLPASEQAGSQQQTEVMRGFMAELFVRGITINQFIVEAGMNGFRADPVVEGLERQKDGGSGQPSYFKLWLAPVDAAVAANGLQALIKDRQDSMPEEWRSQLRLLFFVDIDTENKDFPYPFQAGITPYAVCFDESLVDVDKVFDRLNDVCKSLVPYAQQKLRIGIGQFGPLEYEGMKSGNIFTKRMPFGMASDWLMVKNIARRAGPFGLYWRLLAKWRDRREHG